MCRAVPVASATSWEGSGEGERRVLGAGRESKPAERSAGRDEGGGCGGKEEKKADNKVIEGSTQMCCHVRKGNNVTIDSPTTCYFQPKYDCPPTSPKPLRLSTLSSHPQ